MLFRCRIGTISLNPNELEHGLNLSVRFVPDGGAPPVLGNYTDGLRVGKGLADVRGASLDVYFHVEDGWPEQPA